MKKTNPTARQPARSRIHRMIAGFMKGAKAAKNRESVAAREDGWIRICRMMVNMPYGRQPDLRGWKIPLMEARPADSAKQDIAFRLATAFYKAMDCGGSTGDGLWKNMHASFHGPVVEALENHDMESLAEQLAGMFFSPVTIGLSSRDADPSLAKRNPMARLLTIDAIASLAMSLGLLRVPNPAIPNPANELENDFQAIMETISEFLGWDILPPQAGGIAGIAFRDGVIPLKHFYQLYAAHRLRTVHGSPLDSCLEIGGGVGFLAYVCAVNGVVRDYTIIDLPLVNMLQGYLLLNSSVAGDVELYGESIDESSNRRRIRILPDIAITSLADKSIEFAVNQDSFPEMGHETMIGYFDQIGRIVRGHLLSINHESAQKASRNFTHGLVHATLANRPDFEQLYRMPYWLRPGYVEELFQVVPPTHD